MKATSCPISKEPVEIRWAATQYIDKPATFISIKKIGCVMVIILNNFFEYLVKRWFVSLNRFCSYWSLLKALITRIPLRFSLEIRFKSSNELCWFSEIGLVIFATTTTPRIINGIVAAIIYDNGNEARAVIIKLKINIIGVIKAVRSNTLTNCWIWKASLFVLVIIDDVPIWLNSLAVNCCTLAKISFLISRVIAVDIFEQQYPRAMVPPTPISETKAIQPPII